MERTNVSAPHPVAQAGSLYRGRVKMCCEPCTLLSRVILRLVRPAYRAAGGLSPTRVNENDDGSQTFLPGMQRSDGGGRLRLRTRRGSRLRTLRQVPIPRKSVGRLD